MKIARKSSKLLLMSFLFSLVACGRGESGSSVRMREVSVTDSGSYSQQGLRTAGNCQANEVGMIYDSAAGSQFRDRVAAFVSATMDPNGLGEISGDPNASTGIDLVMSVKVNAQGQVQSGSTLDLGIYDSYVGQNDQNGKLIEPYSLHISQRVQGVANPQTGEFSVQFSDEYGAILFTGKMDQKTIQGTVQFQNSQSYIGGTPASGTLGQFVLPRCAVFQ